MNTNTRYILTATGVAAGLFLVGATANALATDNTAASAPIGSGVVLPSASADPSANPSLVQVEYAENTDPSIAPVVLPDTGWATGPATGAGSVGDDDHGTDDHDNESGDD
jgi:hypothetical protein